jgi:tetratricopeptide (TPR) repeat protein
MAFRSPRHAARTRVCGGLAALVACLALAAPAWASGGARVTGPFWSEVGSPGQRRVGQLLTQARRHIARAQRQLPGAWQESCERALALRLPVSGARVRRGRQRAMAQLARLALRRRAELDAALARLERAAELAPDDPEVLYLMGRTLMVWEQPGPLWSCLTLRRERDAIAVLTRLSRVAPEFRPQDVAFDLGVLHTRVHDFDAAAREYERAVALSLDERDTAVARSNLAEVTMLAGRVERALGHYRRAIEVSSGGRDYLLASWGLAVALDRLGEHASAIEQAGRALSAGGGTMRVLRSDDVFYEPEHEVHYYEGLGHEALAERDDAERAAALAQAASSWQEYLAAEPPDTPFAATASANLERVRAAIEALAQRKRGAKGAQRPSSTAETLP